MGPLVRAASVEIRFFGSILSMSGWTEAMGNSWHAWNDNEPFCILNSWRPHCKHHLKGGGQSETLPISVVMNSRSERNELMASIIFPSLTMNYRSDLRSCPAIKDGLQGKGSVFKTKLILAADLVPMSSASTLSCIWLYVRSLSTCSHLLEG